MLFYDSEFGSPQSYFEQFGIDTSRVLHCPIKDVEQLKFDLINQLEALDEKDDVIIVIDSVGNLASKKELDDAINEKSVADMSRAKAFKSLFRMTTPYLNMKKIPMIAINHTYKEIGLFPKDVVSGGTGIYYSADNIWIIGRRQNKTGTEVTGYDFVIKVDKSRYTKEQSKIPISVSWDGGVQKWSGLLDVALAGGYVVKPSNGWYSRNGEDRKFRQKETLEEDFWTPIFANTDFKDFLKKQFQIGLPSEVEFDIMVEGDA
jgi:RecA/RadA recombinase